MASTSFKALAGLAILSSLAVSKGATKGSIPDSLDQIANAEGLSGTVLNVNKFNLWVEKDGAFPWVGTAAGAAGAYPSPPGIGSIFTEGILWGAKVEDGEEPRIRMNGCRYASGLKAGKVIYDSSGRVIGSEDPSGRQIWRVRRDYQTADLTADAASSLVKPVEEVTLEDIQSVYDQYEYDWHNWPAGEGAPFEDVDNDGSYDPTTDVPGYPGATQTIWLVANDLSYQNDSDIKPLYGSPRIGIEMQMTLWAYSQRANEVLNNVLFKQAKIIYTGLPNTPDSAHIDTMYITQWADPDVGTYMDDLAGWDSTYDMGYAYNSKLNDKAYEAVGLPPPAVGYVLLQGPVRDHKRVKASSFYAKFIYLEEPDYEHYSWTLFHFNILEGFEPRPIYEPEPVIDPLTGQVTTFTFDGDPVTGTGWIDGVDSPPGDRSLWMTSGPFSMALGDTQEVVFALIGAMGTDHINSITKLRENAHATRQYYSNGFNLMMVSASSNYVAADETEITLNTVTVPSIPTVTAVLKDDQGREVAVAKLHDDGKHHDGEANDFRFANSLRVQPTQAPLELSLSLLDASKSYPYDNILKVTTDGPVTVHELAVVSDHLNADMIPNPGENVHLSLSVFNQGQFSHTGLWATVDYSGPLDLSEQNRQSLSDVTPGEIGSIPYDTDDPMTYSTAQIAQSATDGDSLTATITIVDDLWNTWTEVVAIPIRLFEEDPRDVMLMNHGVGIATGSFGYRIFSPEDVKIGHHYQLTITDSIDASGTPGLTLQNLTENEVLLQKYPLPDEFSHNIPITDGFKVVKGTTSYVPSLDWSFEGVNWVSPLSLIARGLSWRLPETDLFSVELVFQNQEDVKANGYAAEGAVYWTHEGYGWAGIGQMPFSAWEIDEKGTRLRQLNVSFSEYENVELGYPPANLVWDMGWNDMDGDGIYSFAPSGGYEIIKVHSSDYNGGVDYNNDNHAFDADIVWSIDPRPIESRSYLESEFNLLLYVFVPPTSRDEYSFAPTLPEKNIPDSYVLHQNFPNPFNTTTRIDYDLPNESSVRLVIYDILGREVVRLLYDTHLPEGRYSAVWNGKNEAGIPVSSGVYFCRLSARVPSTGRSGGRAGNFVKTRKMLMIQ